ncbi:dihydrodipicolinate synthase family protein [Candidatus Cytomitobacter primus]|uniref:Dihydrodipicolinate synthase family protein n=1 Tax=Candidatus Cytomitobacter primus TaxID=2066024 RepID=A0A5C0UGC1_9PROT|nr:dihydrodipicolinate synthase family protein [Candidatus Cytomitobacter primus]QEK38332.1 dihydrodipicolinate synthase family protein [Candidatus Cytomitobacter primus]
MQNNYVAIVTPFLDSGEIDFPSLNKLINHLIQNDIKGIVVGGTTGEGILLTDTEKSEMLQYINNHFPDIDVIGCYSSMALYHYNANTYRYCDKILLSPQYFIKPNLQSKLDYFHKASNLLQQDDFLQKNIIIYNNPSRFSTIIDPELYDELYKIKNIIGIKESGNIVDITKYKKWQWFGGNDDELEDFMNIGFTGMISAVGNICPQMLAQIQGEAQENTHKVSIESSHHITHNKPSAINTQIHKEQKQNIPQNSILQSEQTLQLKRIQTWKHISQLVFSVPSPLFIKYYLYKTGIIQSYKTRFHIIDTQLENVFAKVQSLCC